MQPTQNMRCCTVGQFCVLWYFVASSLRAAYWPSPPPFDANSAVPGCPASSADYIQWENYRNGLEEYLKYHVEDFWTRANKTYRSELEQQRKNADSQLGSGEITMDAYRLLLDEYRSRVAEIDNDLKKSYQRGIAKYQSGMALYKSYRDEHKRWKGW
jgi:hypothetical protein